MGWWFFFFPNIHLDLAPQHARELERDLRRHTRLLFDAMFTHTTHVLQLPGEQRPRTDDPSWHPLTPLGADVQVVTEGDPQQVGCGRARAVSRWFLDDDGIV